MADSTLSITKTTKGKLPRLPFLNMKNAVLGRSYELSVVFVGDRRSRTLNETYRKKSYVPNVLSFPLSKSEGEIFINPHQARRDAHSFGMSHTTCLAFLLIHGMLHLKGLPHGSTMGKLEQNYLKRFRLL